MEWRLSAWEHPPAEGTDEQPDDDAGDVTLSPIPGLVVMSPPPKPATQPDQPEPVLKHSLRDPWSPVSGGSACCGKCVEGLAGKAKAEVVGCWSRRRLPGD